MVFQLGTKNFKIFSQIGFKRGGSFWEPIQTFFCSEIKKSFDYFKTNSDSFSLLEITINSLFVRSLEFLRLYARVSHPTIFALLLFPCTWEWNSKLNGGLFSKFNLFKILNP